MPDQDQSRLGPVSAGAEYHADRHGILPGVVQNPDIILNRMNVFDALDEMFLETGLPRGSQAAMKWYKSLVREMFEQTELSPEETVLRDKSRLIQKSGYKRLGGMYLFNYLPKTRVKIL